jgi:hypothetical protein
MPGNPAQHIKGFLLCKKPTAFDVIISMFFGDLVFHAEHRMVGGNIHQVVIAKRNPVKIQGSGQMSLKGKRTISKMLCHPKATHLNMPGYDGRWKKRCERYFYLTCGNGRVCNMVRKRLPYRLPSV